MNAKIRKIEEIRKTPVNRHLIRSALTEELKSITATRFMNFSGGF